MNVEIEMRTKSEANARGHWGGKASRAADQRGTVFTVLRARCDGRTIARPLVVTLTRIAPRELDDDNLRSALKAVRDGVADWLTGERKKGNDRAPGVRFDYAWRKGAPRYYGVAIDVAADERLDDLRADRDRAFAALADVEAERDRLAMELERMRSSRAS